ncbi:MAG TPA: hypothetical protein VJ203_12880 [Bacteroidales bacterium]|nr:hypothetical protein [Bacteroidales bacterium]
MVKKGDVLWIAMLCGVSAFLIVPELRRIFIQVTISHPYVMGFIKFAILATMGELLTLRLISGSWCKPLGMGYKAFVWGVVGMSIVLMFGLFYEGVAGATTNGLLPGATGWTGRFLQAFFTSTMLNLTFAPVFMAAHRISDTYTDWHVTGKKPTVLIVVAQIDWKEFMRFVVGKTIPFFWIPVQTINFMLPAEYRIIVAAYLSIVLGLILAYARRRKRE